MISVWRKCVSCACAFERGVDVSANMKGRVDRAGKESRRAGGRAFWFKNLQSEGFLVEAIMVLNLVQSLLLERSFDPMQNVVHVMFPRPEGVNVSRPSVSPFV